jgi:hypothetical protein
MAKRRAAKAPELPLQARRYMSMKDLAHLRRRGPVRIHGLPVNVARSFDPVLMVETEFVGVADDDPRLGTVERFKL